jgi:Domain of unknown function (DUF4276)
MVARVACIVEGHGEVESVPILIRRIADELYPELAVRIPHPIRIPKSTLVKAGEIERAVQLAALNVDAEGAILVLLDSDDDCPAELGPALMSRATAARSDLPLAVVLANREFESWFLASAESFRGTKTFPEHVVPPDHPEEIRGAKEWLNRRLASGVYSPTADQASMTHALDIGLARRAASFDKFYREVRRLLGALRRIRTGDSR